MQLDEVPDSEVTLDADLVLLAMGYVGPEAALISEQLGVALDARGNVAVDDGFLTNVEGVYACGDASRGQSLVVWAISDGRETARAVDALLRGGKSALPTRGMDRSFG